MIRQRHHLGDVGHVRVIDGARLVVNGGVVGVVVISEGLASRLPTLIDVVVVDVVVVDVMAVSYTHLTLPTNREV